MPRRIRHLEIPWMVFASLEVHCLNEGISSHLYPSLQSRSSRAKTGSWQTRPCCLSDHLLRPQQPNWALSAVNKPSAGVNLPYFYRPKSKTTNMIIMTEWTIWQSHTETKWTCCLCRRGQRLPPRTRCRSGQTEARVQWHMYREQSKEYF